ncbi:MAG TPA: DoxX family protein [Vicinamibacterales bacterium]|nr:DoxX family protein [Vicinamibacterales bacterium]
MLGRVVFGGYFLYNGINHFLNERRMSQYAASKGVGAPDAAVTSSGALLAAGGLSVLAGVKPKQGLAAIIGFLVPVTLQMHRFWEETDPERRMNETINFGKNVALVGAALTMLQIAEPWPISVDGVRAKDEEMFIRLGGRDLRALPV